MAQSTIDKIRNAESEADQLINNAHLKAQQIINKARVDAKEIVDKAKLDAINFDKKECDTANKQVNELFIKDESLLSDDLSKQKDETLKKEQDAIKAVLNALI